MISGREQPSADGADGRKLMQTMNCKQNCPTPEPTPAPTPPPTPPTPAPTAAPTPTPFNITFRVNTELIEVGSNGIWLGGPLFSTVIGTDSCVQARRRSSNYPQYNNGECQENNGECAVGTDCTDCDNCFEAMHALSDDDGDGIWSVTLTLPPDTTGNYMFFNGAGAGDIASSRYPPPTGQWCAGDEVTLPPVTENTVIHSCYGDCSDSNGGSCPPTYNVTFHVNTELIEVGNGIWLGGALFTSGTRTDSCVQARRRSSNYPQYNNGECQENNGECAVGTDCTDCDNCFEAMHALSDDDGDGIWSVTLPLLPGTTGNYKFFNGVDGRPVSASSQYPANQWCAGDEVTLPPVTENTVIHSCYGGCSNSNDGSCPPVYDVTFNVNTANIQVGSNGLW